MSKIILATVKLYQKLLPLRFFLGRFLLFPSHTCRFYPTCSAYFSQAVIRYGIIRGGWLGLNRLLRCHPYAKGGHDPLI